MEFELWPNLYKNIFFLEHLHHETLKKRILDDCDSYKWIWINLKKKANDDWGCYKWIWINLKQTASFEGSCEIGFTLLIVCIY